MESIVWIYSGILLVLFSRTSCNTIFDNIEVMDDYALESGYCLASWTCSQEEMNTSDVINLRMKNCQCDEHCSLYGDCCENVKSDWTGDIFETSDLLECEYLPEIQEVYYSYVIQRCPAKTSGTIKELCEQKSESDLILRTPVTGLQSGLLYRNMYCAICNHENYEYWLPGIDCAWKHQYTGNVSFVLLKDNPDCKIKYISPDPDFQPRPCFPVVDSCQTGESNDTCVSGSFALVFGNTIYRNKECAMCNGEIYNLSCNAGVKGLFKPISKRFGYSYSYRLLIDINTNVEKQTSKKRERLQYEREHNHAAKCSENEVYDPFLEFCRKIFCEHPYVLNNSKCLLPEHELLPTRFRSDKKTDSLKDINKLTCPKVRLNESDYQILNDSGNMLILSSAQIVERGHFYFDGPFVIVCLNYTRRLIDEPRIESILFEFSSENLLSLIGMILSIVFLLIGLIIYIRFKKLQNIPGKNLICLMSGLFFGQLFFLVAPNLDNEIELCKAVAILVHILFLSSFFWMNIMAFDICFTFSKSFVRSGDRGKSTKRFYMYLAYGWLTPFCIVLVSVCLDQTKSSFGARYGDGVCWITNQKALLVFFLVPLIILISANIIMFILTSRSIYISDKSSSQILQKKDKCRLFIYIKLCIIMGLTWISGFVATFSNVTALWYIFIIFNSMQGVFIFFAFVCNKKVLNLIRGRTRSKTLGSKMSGDSKSTKSNRTVISVLSRNSESIT